MVPGEARGVRMEYDVVARRAGSMIMMAIGLLSKTGCRHWPFTLQNEVRCLLILWMCAGNYLLAVLVGFRLQVVHAQPGSPDRSDRRVRKSSGSPLFPKGRVPRVLSGTRDGLLGQTVPAAMLVLRSRSAPRSRTSPVIKSHK